MQLRLDVRSPGSIVVELILPVGQGVFHRDLRALDKLKNDVYFLEQDTVPGHRSKCLGPLRRSEIDAVPIANQTVLVIKNDF